MAYAVILSQFEGPLDLLLHLIQKQEISVHEVSLSDVTDQYVAYLRAMEQLSLEVASEFVVMAATLLAIKSRLLLPRPVIVIDEEIVGNPEEELIRQLIEYQKCKWAASLLKERAYLQSLVYGRDPIDLRPFTSTEPLALQGMSLWGLVDAFRKLQSRLPEQQERVVQIRGHVVSVAEMSETVITQLRAYQRLTFHHLARLARNRQELVTIFLVILELLKNKQIVCHQQIAFDDIEIEFVEESNDVHPISVGD